MNKKTEESRIAYNKIASEYDASKEGQYTRFHIMELSIVNDIRNFVFGLAEAAVYGSCKSRKQKFVMLFTITHAFFELFCSCQYNHIRLSK